MKNIKTVRSHSQAIGQCQNLINKKNFKSIISADTAGSAKDLSEGSDKSIAAIASELAAQIYNLNIIDSNFQGTSYNVTRFLVMSKDMANFERKTSSVAISILRDSQRRGIASRFGSMVR